MLMAAMAVALIAGSASASELSATVGYQDQGIYAASATLAGSVSDNFVVDATGAMDWNNSGNNVAQRVEVAGTLFNDRFAVRTAIGSHFGDADFGYFSVTPSVSFDVPYTDTFVVSARYRNALDTANNYETYGLGVRAGWNVGPVLLSTGIASYKGDSDYTEYTVGVSRSF